MVNDIRETGGKNIETERRDRNPYRCYVSETDDRGKINESAEADRYVLEL